MYAALGSSCFWSAWVGRSFFMKFLSICKDFKNITKSFIKYLNVHNVRVIVKTSQRKRGEKMKVTTRIVMDVEPEIKNKLKEISKLTDVTMTKILTDFIEKEHERVMKNK